MIGLHIRGADKGAARASRSNQRIIDPEAYYPEVDDYLQRFPAARIFLATDQQQFLVRVRQRYGDRLLSTESERSEGVMAPFQIQHGRGYEKGREVLLDCMLLSRCGLSAEMHLTRWRGGPLLQSGSAP